MSYRHSEPRRPLPTSRHCSEGLVIYTGWRSGQPENARTAWQDAVTVTCTVQHTLVGTLLLHAKQLSKTHIYHEVHPTAPAPPKMTHISPQFPCLPSWGGRTWGMSPRLSWERCLEGRSSQQPHLTTAALQHWPSPVQPGPVPQSLVSSEHAPRPLISCCVQGGLVLF